MVAVPEGDSGSVAEVGTQSWEAQLGHMSCVMAAIDWTPSERRSVVCYHESERGYWLVEARSTKSVTAGIAE